MKMCGVATAPNLIETRLRVAVVEIRPVDAAEPRAQLHLRQRVGDVGVAQLVEPDGLRIVRVDRDERDALAAIVLVELFDPALVELRDRAVIALEDERQHLGAGVLAGLVGLAVDAGQREVRERRADRQHRVFQIRLDPAPGALGRRLACIDARARRAAAPRARSRGGREQTRPRCDPRGPSRTESARLSCAS